MNLTKKTTYVIAFAVLTDLIGRIFFQYGFSPFLGKRPGFWGIMIGCFAAGAFLRSAGYFQLKTAKNIMYFLASAASFQTASYAAHYLPTSTPSFLLYLLGIGFETLTLYGCFVHLRKIGSGPGLPSHERIGDSGRAARFWAIGFILGFIVGGIPLLSSQLIKDRINPFEAWIYWFWGSGLFFSAMAITLSQPHRIWRWGVAVGLGLPGAVALRLVTDLFQDPASHNLFPLTVFFSGLFGFLASFAGAAFGIVVKGLRQKTQG